MLTNSASCKSIADRDCARSAYLTDSGPINISIRAKVGELRTKVQTIADLAIDKWRGDDIICVIDWPAIMNKTEALRAIQRHQQRCRDSLRWFAGVRNSPRRHPWDERQFGFATEAWIDVTTDTSEGAQEVAQRLFELGYVASPLHTESESGRHIFAYATKSESSN